MDSIKLGTIEPLIVGLRDRLELITDLSTVLNLRYDVAPEDGANLVTDAPASYDGMNAICLIDTTVGVWAVGEHHLYLKYDIGSESPVHGPIRFRIQDD